MQKFVNSLQAVADSPNSIASRQTMLSQAQSLVERLKSYDSSLRSLDSQVKRPSGAKPTRYLAGAAASRSQQTDREWLRQAGQPPNDLLDQRDA